jgi:P2-related tail formation protein
MTGFVDGVTEGEDLVVDYREMIVAHQDVIRRVVPFVAVRQVAVAFLVDVAVAGYKQVGPSAEDGSYAVKREGESDQASNCFLCNGRRVLTRDGSTPRTISSRRQTWSAVRPGCSSA